MTVRKINNYFELISGERRLRAAKLAGLRSVPCIIVDISDERSAVLALIENIQRSDLNFFEEAEAISILIKEYGMTQEDAAIRLGMAQSTIANKLRLLKLTSVERKMIISNNLSERHARALLKLNDAEMRHQVLVCIIENNLTVDKTEKYISSLETKRKNKKQAIKNDHRFSEMLNYFLIP